ncbi:hypothetical protein ANRL3_00734 [Anaerolineae bacterium]|nr:hypothetical protein ANRL3_00734 [Anaerolineae bacterium]
MARATDLQIDDLRAVNATIRAMGQGLFLLLTPDGYPETGASWINTGALLARWNMALIVAANRVPQGKVDWQTPMINAIGANATAKFDAARVPEIVALILASPHFQYR